MRYENNYKLIFCFKIGENIIEYIVNIMNYKNISKDINNKNLKESNENYFVTPFETKPYIYYKYNERILSYPINKKIEIIYILDGQIHFSNSNTNNCKTFTNKNNNKLGEIYLNDNYPFICKYEDDWFPLIYFNKQDIRYINTVQLYTIEFIEKFIKKNGLSKFLNYLYTEEYFSNNFFNSIKNGIFYKYNIYDTRDIISINNQYDKNNFYSEFTKLINDEKIEIILDNFERYIKDHSNNYNDKNFIIDFKTIAAEIYYNPKIIYEIKQLFPEIIRNKFDEKNEYNDFTKDYSTYCFIVNLRELLFEKYRSNGYRLVIYFKKLKNIQKKLLLELYTDKIDDKENETPSIIIKQQKKNDFFKSTKIKSNLINSIEENENKNTKQISLIFLIEGDDSFPIDKEKKINKSINNNNNNELNNTMISEKINIVELPEIYMNEGMNKNINLYSLKTNYDKFIKCARGFPSYLKYILSQSDNKDEKNKAKHYFDMMLTLYSETVKFKNGNSIIKDKIKEYNFSFEETIQILKNAGLELNNIDILQNINFDSKIKSYIIFPDIKEIETKEDIWELNKDFNQEENYYNNISLFNNYKNSINEIGVLKTKKHDDIILNNFNSNEEDNKIIFEYNQKNDFINEEIEGDLLLDELSSNINEDDIISSSEDDKNEKEEEDNFKKDNNFFISSKKIAKDETDKQSATREKFDKLEAQFNEDYAISFIIKKIKNKIDENDLFFEFEKTGKELNGFEPSEDLLNKNINIEGNMPIIDLLEESKFITSRLITSISQFNADQENYEINFKNLEINILFDCTRLISNENRYFNLLLICGLVNCCYSLGIQYSLSLIGDSDFKIKIKSIEEEHSEIALQMLYDCAFIKRNITQLPACIKYFINKYPPKEINKNSVFYIFTNGYDEELKKIDEWKTKIFNNPKNSFNFIFLKSTKLNKIKNKPYKIFFENEWKNFKEKTQNLASIVKISILNMKDICDDKNIEEFIKNISFCLLREKEENDTSLKIKPKFEIEEIKNYDNNHFISLTAVLGNQLDKEEFNELFIKRNKLPLIYDTQKEDNKEFRELCKNTGKLIKCSYSGYQPEITNLIKKILSNKKKVNKSFLNTIFKPNLPTQEILCEEGTHLDVTELIKYSINKVPNPKLYREIRDGFIKNYGATIVIDSSISCLNDFSKIHTIQTISILLSSLAYDNISCLDLIITTNKEPIIICSEKLGNQILSEKSNFWITLFSLLVGYKNCDLSSGIKAAFNIIRARRSEHTNYIFVLTDGLYRPSQRERIIGVVNNCYYRNINIFGIGIGIYPIGIEKLFPQVIYSQNPYKLIEGISLVFGDISKYKDNKMSSLYFKRNENNILEQIENQSKKINVIFKKLKNELNKIKITLESFAFYQPELPINKFGDNPSGEDDGMYPKNFFEGQYILIAMFYSSDLKSEKDGKYDINEQKINPKYITIKLDNNECISSVLNYYGYNVKVVTNYEDAINELNKTNLKGKCFYNSLWIISGREIDELPSDKGDRYAACYVEQFINCSLIFWKNGGSIFLMAENDPYNFQANLFLRTAVFPGNKKLQFHLGGNSPGGKILTPYNKDIYLEKSTFNKKIQQFCNVERKSIANNLIKIYEGITLSYAQGKTLYPFIPFSKDSSGHFNSMFYNGTDDGNGLGEGDIFIDCSYTKFFINMTKEGTSRYLQNISAFLGSVERRANTGYHPREFRPEKVNFSLNKNKILHYKFPKIPYDLLYLVDATGSMDNSIEAVKNYCVDISNILNSEMRKFDFKFGAVFYRDPRKQNDKKNENEYINFTEDPNKLQNFISKITAHGGGGDGPEDWVSAYRIVVNNLKWRDGVKFIIHIADAPAHGSPNDYCHFYSIPKEAAKLDKLIEEIAKKKFFVTAFCVDQFAEKSFLNCKNIFIKNSNNNYEIKEFDQNNKTNHYFTNLVVSSSIGVARKIES